MELSADQQRIAQAAYDIFRHSGRWPIIEAIDRLADERWELDAYQVLRSLPSSIGLVDRLHLRGDQPIKLRVRAIAACEGSQSDLELFVRAVRWLAEKERGFRPQSPHEVEQPRVTSEQLIADLAGEGFHVDSVASAKVQSLAKIERLTWGGTYRIDGDRGKWEIGLSRDIRPFRRVETLDDFLAIQDRREAAVDEELRQTQHPSTLVEMETPGTPARAPEERNYAFIAMPFEAAWSSAVYQCIGRACERVHADGLPLRWERADGMERPGRITEQIRDALTTADVVIADITGLNINVIYELGFADANETPLIILSQDPDASPFDLKDMRQIQYSPEGLDIVQERLVLHLRAALGADGR